MPQQIRNHVIRITVLALRILVVIMSEVSLPAVRLHTKIYLFVFIPDSEAFNHTDIFCLVRIFNVFLKN